MAKESGLGLTVTVDNSAGSGQAISNDITNLIASNASFTTNINIGRALTHGFESFIRAKPFDGLGFRLDHTYTQAIDRTNGAQLVRRPAHKIGFSADYQPDERWDLGAGLTYDGKRSDFDADSFARIYPGGYSVARATASYKLTEKWALFARAENVLNKRYEEPSGFNQPRFGALAGVRAGF